MSEFPPTAHTPAIPEIVLARVARVNPKYIQQQLGHGSISITLDIYSHLFQGDHQHHVHQLDDAQEPEARDPQPRRNLRKRGPKLVLGNLLMFQMENRTEG